MCKHGRPSLDSAAGSVAVSSLVVAPRRTSPAANGNTTPPQSIVGAGGATGRRETVLEGVDIGGGGDGMRIGDGDYANSKRSVPGLHDDDAASQYGDSSVAQQQQTTFSRGSNDSSLRGGAGPEAGRARRHPSSGCIVEGPAGLWCVVFWLIG